MEGKKKKKKRFRNAVEKLSLSPMDFRLLGRKYFFFGFAGIRSSSHGGIKFLRRASGNDRVYRGNLKRSQKTYVDPRYFRLIGRIDRYNSLLALIFSRRSPKA